MKKRFLAVFLALALCLCLCPVSAFAAESDFVIKDGVLQSYNGPGGDVVIPDGVTSIGIEAFCTIAGFSVTSVTIPEGVTSIERDAFSGCTSLTSVTISSSVTKIGASAFSGCTNLTSVTIPDSVTTIEGNAFENTPWQASLGDFAIVNGILMKYQGSGGDVIIPEGVTSIAIRAFEYCESLTSVTIPEGVTSIEYYTFSGCTGLTSVTIPEGVTSIKGYAFLDCTSLTNVTIPESVTSIEWDAFGGCASLTSVTIPDSVTSIESSTFTNCTSLTSVTIPESVTSIGNYAFSECSSLTSVTIPSSVTKIAMRVFWGCTSLTSVTIPSGVTDIEWGAFSGCKSLTSVTIPESVTSIGTYAFSDCSSLTSVIIPEGVTSIGDGAFSECTGLTDVYYGGSEAQWSTLGFQVTTFDPKAWDDVDITGNATIHYNSVIAKFPDLKPNGFYVDAVEWALEKNITTGKTETSFQPETRCSHAEILTFLWRAAGKPMVDVQTPFHVEGYYADAARWAYSKGMIDQTFQYNKPCTRADAVNYIWQAFDKPAASYDGRFTDVPASSPRATAVAWAFDNGVTTGATKTTFNPNGICNRGQIVTFLYRAYK